MATGVLRRQLWLHSPHVIQLERLDVVGSSATEASIMNALILVVIVAVISVVIFSSFNRKTGDKVSAARNGLRKQAAALCSYSVSEFLRDTGLAEEDHRTQALLGALAGILEVESAKLAHPYPMRDLLVILVCLDGQNKQQAIDPFSSELLDLIVKMNVGEFLRFFSPLMKSVSR